jgi:hypothetical protein
VTSARQIIRRIVEAFRAEFGRSSRRTSTWVCPICNRRRPADGFCGYHPIEPICVGCCPTLGDHSGDSNDQ